MEKEGLFVNYGNKLRQSMSLMEILMVLPSDGAAIIHRQHSEAPPTPNSKPRIAESSWSSCRVDP